MEIFGKFRKKGVTLMRHYCPGESLAGVSVGIGVEPCEGGMIACDHANTMDRWYISPEYFAANYEPVI